MSGEFGGVDDAARCRHREPGRGERTAAARATNDFPDWLSSRSPGFEDKFCGHGRAQTPEPFISALGAHTLRRAGIDFDLGGLAANDLPQYRCRRHYLKQRTAVRPDGHHRDLVSFACHGSPGCRTASTRSGAGRGNRTGPVRHRVCGPSTAPPCHRAPAAPSRWAGSAQPQSVIALPARDRITQLISTAPPSISTHAPARAEQRRTRGRRTGFRLWTHRLDPNPA